MNGLKKDSNDFDFDGEIAAKGKVNEILSKALEKYFIKQNLNSKIKKNILQKYLIPKDHLVYKILI